MKRMKREDIAIGGAIIAALAASLCCVGPLLFVLLGVGAFGAATVFEAARPFLLAVAVLLLAFGFYRAYVQPRRVCSSGESCAVHPPSGKMRFGLWLATIAVIAFALLPRYAGQLVERWQQSAQPTSLSEQSVTLRIGGMSCASCATTVKLALEGVAGVHQAEVNFDRAEAVVKYDPRLARAEDLIAAVHNSGYSAEIIETAASLSSMGQRAEEACCTTVRSLREGDQMNDSAAAVQYSKDLDNLRAQFNRDRGRVRLITLLSPTCPGCAEKGVSELRDKLLAKINSDDLRLYVVWVPALPTDDEGKVPAAAMRLTDGRVRHYWDAHGEMRTIYQRLMNMREPAWDVYYVYDRSAEWGAEPPKPNYYTHQLRSLPPEFMLNGDKLSSKVNELIAARARS
ncbi:MAG: hypothetical protein C4334_03935 [Pyrinomonas sp.]|uniref:mercuric transporter MerT family protein n=1 Tax=Pyrinomonas sp. TaxID=2080306 RepID=UPI00331D1CEF